MQDELVRLQMGLRKTIVFITHDPREALKIGDRIAIMRDGRVVQVGTPESIVFRPEDEYVGEFTRDIRRHSILTASSVMVEPRLVVAAQDKPREVLPSLRRDGDYVAQVIDANGNYLGSLGWDQCQRAAEDNVPAILGCQDYLETGVGVSPVQSDTPIDDIILLCLSGDQPIPVVNRSGTLVGEIHRSAVAEAIQR
jgi:glycine betaine/proline transport system ATP-binding protein